MTKSAMLLSTAAVAALSVAGPVWAQAPSRALEEVVVTATRQTSTVNKVALSITAATQKTLDQQGVATVNDLQRQAPGLTFRIVGQESNPAITVRGIGGNAAAGRSGGSATTGVYLDDVGLQQRTSAGLVTGSNQPLPILFDLDRVEILRGPQGTLYGGASEGGAVRFITPAPSTTTYSGVARADVSTVTNGGVGHSVGIGVGGPLIQDKLGFRLSLVEDGRPGWIDELNQYTGQKFASDVNFGKDYAGSVKVLWNITPELKATVSYFSQMNFDNDNGQFRFNSPSIFVHGGTFINNNLASGGGINGVKFSFPNVTYPSYTIPAQNFFGINQADSNGIYTTQQNATYQNSPRRTLFNVPSLTVDYNWHDKIGFKSITNAVSQLTTGFSFQGGGGDKSNLGRNSAASGQPGSSAPFPLDTTAGVLGNGLSASPPTQLYTNINPTTGKVDGGVYPYSNIWAYTPYRNQRDSYGEEFRIQSIDPSARLQFVVGGYYNHSHIHLYEGSNWNEPFTVQALRGVPERFFLGEQETPLEQQPGGALSDLSTRVADILEDDMAVFGEATFAVTSKLKVTLGGRYTDYHQTFAQSSGGSVTGAPPGFVGTSSTGQTITINGVTYPYETNPNSLTPFPTNYAACPSDPSLAATNATALPYAKAGCPYQYVYNKLHESPFSPKASISYNLTQADLVYFTYSEGFRVGGVNPPVFASCGPSLTAIGLAVAPQTYQHDSTKSYEVGGKFRLFEGRAQLNASVFKIDWQNVQFTNLLGGCGSSYVANGAAAVSEGFETNFTGRLADFTLNSNVAYDYAAYAQDVKASPLATTVIARKGDNLGVPMWTVNSGLQYDHRFFERPVYARVDYMYTGRYNRTTGPGTSGYFVPLAGNTSTYFGNETHTMNARAGVYLKNLEVAFYVKNLTDSKEIIDKGQVTNQPAIVYGNSFQPRTFGMQMNYRF